jgi:two-component system nitrate/nitrite sensor histidine kinase NarX
MPFRRSRWVVIIVPALVVGTIELLSDTILDTYIPFPWDTIMVMLVVAGFSAGFARWAFGRQDQLTATLEARNAEVEARAASASALHAVSLAIASTADIDTTLRTTVDSARSLLRADLALLILTGTDGRPGLRATSGPAAAFDRSGGHDGGDVSRFLRDGSSSILAAPLRRGGATIGSLAVVGRAGSGPEVRDLETLSSLANQAAVAIENDRLGAELRRTAVQHERERIATEIHDGLAQVLGYVNTKSQAVEGLLGAGRIDEARFQMSELSAAARSIYVDVREAIVGLSAGPDDDLDLSTQVRTYAARYAEAAKLAVTVEIGRPETVDGLPAPVRAAVFGIIREALTNVRKHAGARRVTVEMGTREGDLLVAVIDDGRGFDPDRLDSGSGDWPHYGMTTMSRRAAETGGRITWTSEPGAGCRVELAVPLDRPDDAESMVSRTPGTATRDEPDR